MTGGVEIRKAVSNTRPNPLHADPLGWEQQHVVKTVEGGRLAEGFEEPRAMAPS